MTNLEAEFKTREEKGTWLDLFMEIDAASVRHSKNEAMRGENSTLNRYINVAPFDDNRIKLQRTPHDYINASLIDVPQANRRYILTQGPLSNTISHFWVMIWEQDSRAIVMLNKLIEQSIPKCEFYWPEGKGDEGTLDLEDVHLTVTFIASYEPRINFLIREFKLTDHISKQSRIINQYHYTEWPDFGQPESPVSFLKLLSAVRSSGGLDTHGPAVVHCSAGIGRSGTFCLIDSVLLIIENNRSTEGIVISDILLDMRKHRAGLIQTAEQLRFSYMAIIYGTKLLKVPEDKLSTSQQDTQRKSSKGSSDSANYAVVGDIAPLPSPGNVMNQPLLGQKSYSEASKSSSGTNILQRRRERELRNQRLSQRTKNIRDSMRSNEGRVEERARKLRLLKNAGAACGIAAVMGSAFYIYYKSYFSN